MLIPPPPTELSDEGAAKKPWSKPEARKVAYRKPWSKPEIKKVDFDKIEGTIRAATDPWYNSEAGPPTNMFTYDPNIS